MLGFEIPDLTLWFFLLHSGKSEGEREVELGGKRKEGGKEKERGREREGEGVVELEG